jgi:glucoamylase
MTSRRVRPNSFRYRRSFAALTTALLTAAVLAPVSTASAAPTAAADAPGALSHFDQSRKDCLGTARNNTSKIWYTVANGVLSDVYAPTVDTTNVETMQYLVTDGTSFTDVQTRDTTYSVATDPSGMMCTVTSTAKSGAYQLVTTYLTDASHSSVVVRTRYVATSAAAKAYRVYVRLDATVAGNGGGGSGNGGADTAVVDRSTGSAVPVSFDTVTTTNAVNRDYAVPTYLALRADQPFSTVSSGFVGTAGDGLAQLDASHTLTANDTATAGNVEQTAGVQRDSTGAFTLALGFGTTQAAAVATAAATVGTHYSTLTSQYLAGWKHYDAGLRKPSRTLSGLTAVQRSTAVAQYYQSANVVRASMDKTFAGAVAAGLDSPWGQAVSAGDPNNTYFGSYREVFGRDLYEAWTAFYTDGDLASAKATTRFLLLRQQLADGSLPRNSLLNGKPAPDAFNTQLDEAAYPLLMALQSGLGGDAAIWKHVKAGANFLVSHGPTEGVERWEEQTGYSPSTIAAEIAGLVAAGTIARQHGDTADARTWLATADVYQRSIKKWTVTTTGPYSTSPYFIRLSKNGDPDSEYNYGLGNGGATSIDQRAVVDLGFLELVRLGELPATDPAVANSVRVIDAKLERQTANGPGWLRYNGDGYGDCYEPDPDTSCPATGQPWAATNTGTGHIWPVLAAERAQQDLATGQRSTAASLLATINSMTSGPGLVPEQVWDEPDVPASASGSDPTTASIGFVNGKPDGSASPLTWGAAAQVRLTADLTAGRSVERPSVTTARYVNRLQKTTPLTVTSPTDGTEAGATIVVSGTAAPRATIDVADIITDNNNAATHVTTTADASGTFSVRLPSAAGTDLLLVTSTSRDGGTAQVELTVVRDVVDGALIYDHGDPAGDDNGPGTYQYPSAGDFHAGAFDLTDFQIYDTGTTVTFRVQTADLTATFGSSFGAQLLDLYVHDPAATATATASAYPSLNYSIEPASAWDRLIEVQGFGQRFVDSTGATVGPVTTRSNPVSRYTTFSVDKAALGGTPGAGWKFVVTLTGQDGSNPSVPPVRAFTQPGQAYTFGVCAPGGTAPICSVDPNSVAKVMDVVTPDGVSQASELDVTAGPVVLAGITL